MRLLVDGNSVLNASILGGKDEEYGFTVVDAEGKKHQVNGFQYGTDKFFDRISEGLTEFDCAPRDIVLVWDGKNAKNRRLRLLNTYKAGRDKVKEVSDQINLARDQCTQTMLGLGATVVSQPGYEADDVIGYLARNLRSERNVVVTSDGDLSVLVDENTDVWRLGKLNENPYGPFPHKHITLYKALVGDSSDKIPGAKGFGDAAFVNFVRIFGLDGLAEMERMIRENCLGELADSVSDLKALQRILESQDMVKVSWACASLYPDEINTGSNPLSIQAGMVKQWGSEAYQVTSLRRFYGTKTLVTSDNYAAIYQRLAASKFADAPFIALDIETSTTPESDGWMEQVKAVSENDKDRLDVLGSELTGMSLTFGQNTQHTIYMSVDHKDTPNITVDQCREMCELIPQSKHVIIQNRSFEFAVLYKTWGDKWKGNGWYGFVPNALDTKVGASYVNENLRKGLKERSKEHLGYSQVTYDQVTCRTGKAGEFKGGTLVKAFKKTIVPAVYEQVEYDAVGEDGETYKALKNGKLISKAVKEDWETRQYKMNDLTAAQVLDYGCDDTICTAALHTYYKFVMLLENTWQVYLDVETLPEYLTSLAFTQGIPVSYLKLVEMERRDDATYDTAWGVLRQFLIDKGWTGVVCPEFEGDIEPSDVKLCAEILLDDGFSTRKKKLNAIAADIRTQYPEGHALSEMAGTLANVVEANDVNLLNRLVKRNFSGEPKINFGSPKQMQNLFYNVIGIKPRIVNSLTDKERDDPVKVEAFKKRREEKSGKTVVFTPEERKALIAKSSTDDTAVDSALAMDTLTEEAKKVLKAYKSIKEIQTRRGLFYKPYKALQREGGRIHASLNQCEAVTRRYSSSSPNIQQLPSKGEGAHFREILLPHAKSCVVVSLDFSGQELRLGAELSGDEAMTSCYIGDNLRDMHSLTAVAAAATMWGVPVTYDDFQEMRKSKDQEHAKKAKALRDSAKTVNFASQYGAMAAKIAESMMCDEETAQAFLDARAEAFPGILLWDKRVQKQAKELGYAQTMLGARRHLREALSDENNHYDRSKAERQVGNFWIQGSAAEMSKLAMVRVWERGLVTSGKYRAVFYCPIHDELVFSVHKDDAVEFIKEAHACMVANYAGMKIPLESSIAIGPNFAADYEVGNLPDPEAIQKVLDEIFHKNQEERKAA